MYRFGTFDRKRGRTSPLFALATLFAASPALAQEEGRFDAQVFRPLAAPRDLVMVPKTEVIGQNSPVLGLYLDAALNPLSFVNLDTGRTLHAVGSRLTITPMAGVGLFGWAELTMAVPFVSWQTSDNLRSIGTEGPVRASPGLGDIRLSTKISMPSVNRKADVRSGLGLALGANINLPTGDELAFTSDGGLSGGLNVIADYRFNVGLLVTSNLGIWIRPERQFASVKIADMAQFGVAAEMYIVQRWGLSAIGEVYGYPALTKYPDDIAQVPAEALLGVRWYTRQGITVTIGGSFGAACGFGAPALRVFNSITWQPKTSDEQSQINRLHERDSGDKDSDGVLDAIDQCPDVAGVPQSNGCPPKDRDADGTPDDQDQCPELASSGPWTFGCPGARIKGDYIVTFEPIRFASGSSELSDRSKLILDSIVRLLYDDETIREVEVEGHTDVLEVDTDAKPLSDERANRAMFWLSYKGVQHERLTMRGYVHLWPAIDDSICLEPSAARTRQCEEDMQENRRVEVRIKRRGPRPPWAILVGGPASVLPYRFGGNVAQEPLFPTCGSWPNDMPIPIPCLGPKKAAVLTSKLTLPNAKEAPGRLPKASDHSLPQKGVLQKAGKTLPGP